jgi:hypothetical protein
MPIDVPFMTDVQQTRRAVPKYALPSRAEDKTAARKKDDTLLRLWRAAVWLRDKGKDRHTGKKVLKTIALDVNRGECHHVEPRENEATRYDRRNGVLLSYANHELVERNQLRIVGTKFFVLNGRRYIDCDYPVKFIPTQNRRSV